jgi:hypothetical protein
MSLDRRYVVCALTFAVVGLGLGIFMAATHNHSELVAHAHILLIGFVLSFIYGIIHKLWLVRPGRAIANAQFALHLISAITLSIGLFLIYGGIVEVSKLDAILGVASFGVLLGMLLMIVMVFQSGARQGTA